MLLRSPPGLEVEVSIGEAHPGHPLLLRVPISTQVLVAGPVPPEIKKPENCFCLPLASSGLGACASA